MKEYIEREALMDEIHRIGGHNLCEWDTIGVKALVDRQPAADVVEVRHGVWDDNIIGFCNVCMECGAIVERTAIKNKSGELNYCPNCGAKMDGKGE